MILSTVLCVYDTDRQHRLVDGIWTDEDVEDPLAKMVELLNKTSNRSLIQRWGIWLTKKDADLGLKVPHSWCVAVA